MMMKNSKLIKNTIYAKAELTTFVFLHKVYGLGIS